MSLANSSSRRRGPTLDFSLHAPCIPDIVDAHVCMSSPSNVELGKGLEWRASYANVNIDTS